MVVFRVLEWREIILNIKWTKLAKLPLFISMLETFGMTPVNVCVSMIMIYHVSIETEYYVC